MLSHLSFGSILFAGAAGYCVWEAWRSFRVWRLIGRTGTTPIGQLKAGFVEIKGKVANTENLLVSPYSQKPCAYYKLVLEQYSGGKRSDWHVVAKEENALPLMLKDETGQVRVSLKGAKMEFKADTTVTSGGFVAAAAPPEFKAFIKNRFDFDTKALFWEKQLRFFETVLQPGDALYVLGWAVTDPNGEMVVEQQKDLLVVSDQEETSVQTKFGRRCVWAVVSALLATGLCLWL